MHINIRRSTYNSSYRQDGIDQAMKLYSVLKSTYKKISSRHSRRIIAIEEFPLIFCRNSCLHDRLPLLFLRFDHSKDLPLAKAKLTSFWNFLSNVGLQGPAIKTMKKFKKSATTESRDDSQIHQQSPFLSAKEPSPVECSPVFKDLKQIFDLFLSKGLDKTALCIDSNYRVHPFICMCQEPCCNCVNYSQHLHKLGLHHQTEALHQVQKNIDAESAALQCNEGRQSMKSMLKYQSQLSTPVPSSQHIIPLVEEGSKKFPVKTPKNITINYTDSDLDIDEDKGLRMYKSPLDIRLQSASFRPSLQSNITSQVSRVDSSQVQVVQELTNTYSQENVKLLKCKPSIRSVRRNFKEIEPEKYQNLLLDLIKNPENCLLSHQSKKERVLRPKLLPNDCQAKRPKWRI